MLVILSIVNACIFAGWYFVLRHYQISYRKILAMLPTPMLGIASSYGVYAFNEMLTPSWVAIIMAAAYEVTYIGLASYTSLTDDQLGRGRRIAQIAASISFLQNAIAGMFYIQPDLMSYQGQGLLTFSVNLCFALLHAAQVWVAYLCANYTLHDTSTKERQQAPQHVHIDIKTIETVNGDGKEPETMEKVPELPEPQTVEIPRKRDVIRRVDDRAAAWAKLHDEGKSYQEIADLEGLSKSYIGGVVKTFRDKQARTEMPQTEIIKEEVQHVED